MACVVSIFASRRQSFRFTVMVLLMDLFIYLVVVWKEAMNLLGLLKRTVLVRSHLPYSVSFHLCYHYLGWWRRCRRCRRPHLVPSPALDCCYGLLGVASDFPADKIKLLRARITPPSLPPSPWWWTRARSPDTWRAFLSCETSCGSPELRHSQTPGRHNRYYHY